MADSSRLSAQRAAADEAIAEARAAVSLKTAGEAVAAWRAGQLSYEAALARVAQAGAEAERVMLEHGWAFLDERREAGR